ncbi:TonB-dependent receptor [Proteiniphilum sp.]|uniref:TonB-dependent receptor n=1 Tax=Proteiniphilum sp. TaxID=1926877 RepID=UPI0033334BDC
MNKYLLFLFILFSCHYHIGAQQIVVKGKIIDSTSKVPLEYATVVLQRMDSTLVKGTTSNLEGYFTFDNIAQGSYRIVISSVGYNSLHIDLINLIQSVDLGETEINQQATELSEITVEASQVIDKSNRKLFFPTKDQIDKSTNGLQLTQRLLLPQLFINLQSSSISYAGDKKIKILINGIESSSQEIVALQPENIKRVDYYDNPGMRYGEDIGIIIDYIVKERTTGGFLSSNLSESLTYGMGNGQLSGGINFKKSQIKFFYYINHNNFKTSTLKEQNFYFPDSKIISREEDGQMRHWSEVFQMGNISYTNYSEKNVYSVKAGLFSVNQRHDDVEGIIANLYNYQKTNFKTQNRPVTLRPSVDFYFSRRIDDKQILAFNVVGTYSKTSLDYLYTEVLGMDTISNIVTYVDGNRYSLIGELFYEKKLSQGFFSAGLRHTQGNTENIYTGTSNFKTEMNDGVTYGFLQYNKEKEKFGYMIGIGVSRTYFNQKGEENIYNKWTISPMLNMNYQFNEKSSLRYSYQLKNINPSLSYLSDVERSINPYQLNKGNPLLDSYLLHENEIRFSFNSSPIRSSLSLSSNYYDNPIMEETYYDNSRDIFVTTYENQKRNHQLRLQFNIGVSLLNDHLSINGYGGYNTRVSQGNHYKHTRNEWFYVLQTIGDYKKWTLTVTMIHLPQPFWGETVSKGHSYNDYNLSYRFPWGQLGITSFNLFGEKSKLYSYNFNQLTGYRIMDINTKIYPSFGIYGSINLNWGKQNKGTKQRLSNTDSETGIL